MEAVIKKEKTFVKPLYTLEQRTRYGNLIISLFVKYYQFMKY